MKVIVQMIGGLCHHLTISYWHHIVPVPMMCVLLNASSHCFASGFLCLWERGYRNTFSKSVWYTLEWHHNVVEERIWRSFQFSRKVCIFMVFSGWSRQIFLFPPTLILFDYKFATKQKWRGGLNFSTTSNRKIKVARQNNAEKVEEEEENH